MVDTTGNSNSGGNVSFTTKEMFAQIMSRLDKLDGDLQRVTSESGRRLQALEAHQMFSDELARHVDKLSADFAGFERRFALHETEPYHLKGGAVQEKLVKDVEMLQAAQTTNDAIAKVVKEMSSTNRQMLMFFISQMLVVGGLLLTAYKVWSGH